MPHKSFVHWAALLCRAILLIAWMVSFGGIELAAAASTPGAPAAPLQGAPRPASARPEIVLQIGHSHAFENAGITQVIYSPDGRLIATLDGDPDEQDIRLWKASTGALWRTLRLPQHELRMIAFAPQGNLLAGVGEQGSSLGGEGEVSLWNVWTGDLIQTLQAGDVGAYALTFSPDGHLLIVLGLESAAAWSLPSLLTPHSALTQTWAVSTEYGMQVTCAPNGNVMALGGFGNSIELRYTKTGQLARLLAPTVKNINERTSSIAFAPDGSLVATATDAGVLRLWDVATGRLLRTWKGHQAAATTVCFSRDGKTLISSGQDGKLCYWESPTGRLRRTVEVDKDGLWCFALASDGQWIAYSNGVSLSRLSVAHAVIDWDCENGVSRMVGVAFTPNNMLLASHSWDGTVRLWDLRTAKLQATCWEGGMFQGPLTISPDSKTLVSVYFDNAVLWDLPSGKMRHKINLYEEPGTPTISPDGSLLALSDPRSSSIRDAQTGQLIRQWEGGTGASGAPEKFLPDSRTLVSGVSWNATGSQVELRDVHTGQIRRTGVGAVPPADSVTQDHSAKSWDVERRSVFLLDVAPNGSSLACLVKWWPPAQPSIPNGQQGANSELQIWDVATGQHQLILTGAQDDAITAIFSPDSRLLATTSKQGKAQIWNIATGTVVVTLTEAADLVETLAFSADSKKLACATTDGRITLWDAHTGRLLLTWVVLPQENDGNFSTAWIAYTPDGYYDASPGATTFIRWRVGTQLYPALRYEKQFHRPDLVQQALNR